MAQGSGKGNRSLFECGTHVLLGLLHVCFILLQDGDRHSPSWSAWMISIDGQTTGSLGLLI